LVNLKDPIARVSTLCIHLQSAGERDAFKVNKEDHTSPVIATTPALGVPNKDLEKAAAEQINGDAWREGQEPALLQAIADNLGVPVTDIADFDLSLYDTQPATVGGLHKEFLYSARLDNLATVFTAVTAMQEHSVDLSDSHDVSVVVFFDHEEVGSASLNGAGSPVMEQAVRRISAALNANGTDSPDLYANAIAKSFCLSIDQAHAVHPNYASKHESQHAPLINGGVVIKTNANQRYATNSLTAFIVRELGKRAAVPIQEFCGTLEGKGQSRGEKSALRLLSFPHTLSLSALLRLFSSAVRNDCPCGSTIGPTISARTGIRTVDAGMPQLSMHSCREVMGTADLTHGLDLFKAFFKHFREIDESIEKD
jgi:aspartyl aminopeptidase